jgi:hypothetical protein
MRAALPVVVALVALTGGCGDDCVELDLECTPQYEPTFDNIYNNTLQGTCGLPGSVCHAAEGAQGGLVLDDPDTAYELLVESAGARVIPGDAACSELTRRIDPKGPGPRMPPGGMLDPGEVCAIEQWIQAGAPP